MKPAELIRKESFSKKIPHDPYLDELVEGQESHEFLANGASQYTYQYLVDYLLNFSAKWFNAPLSSAKILDWGCGKGHITYMLKEKGMNVTSCDVSDQSDFDSAFGQTTPIIQKLGINVVPLTHEYILPFNDNEFDIVLSFGVLEHVPNDLKSLQEINRILKPNGLFFCFFLPYNYSWTQKLAHIKGDMYHDRFYNRSVVNDLLNNSNYKLIDFWHRALLPKNTIKYSNYYAFEKIDQIICEHTFLKHLATNVEFVAVKGIL